MADYVVEHFVARVAPDPEHTHHLLGKQHVGELIQLKFVHLSSPLDRSDLIERSGHCRMGFRALMPGEKETLDREGTPTARGGRGYVSLRVIRRSHVTVSTHVPAGWTPLLLAEPLCPAGTYTSYPALADVAHVGSLLWPGDGGPEQCVIGERNLRRLCRIA